jgi:hypothetical protein
MAKASGIASGALSGAGTGAMIGMAGGPAGAAIGAGIGALGGAAIPLLMGDGSELSEQEQKLRLEALEMLSSIQDPELQKLALEEYTQTGQISPQMEKEILLRDTEMKNINVDPRLKQAQMEALQSLQEVGRTGLRPEDRLALEEINLKAARDAQAQREAILQNRQMRGVATGGDALAAQLQGAQGAADQGRMAGLSQAAMAQRAALEGLSQSGRLGGEIRGQEFGEQAQITRQQDEINRFNTGNQIALQQRNIAAQNAAQAENVRTAQGISNMNVSGRNQATRYNTTELPQQQFDNTFKLTGAKANAKMGYGGYLGEQAANKQAANQQMLQGAAQAAGTGAQMYRGAKADARDQARLDLEQQREYDRKAGLAKKYSPNEA